MTDRMGESVPSHGGNLREAARFFGVAPESLQDFSANINPLGIPAELMALLGKELDGITHYPDPECRELVRGISSYTGFPDDWILPGNGASEILYLLMDVMKFKRVAIPAPTFSEYAQAAARAGSRVEWFPAAQAQDFKLDIPGLLDFLAGGFDALVLCNPNNPTSRLLSRQDLLFIMQEAEKRGLFVVVDEAFIELTHKGTAGSVAKMGWMGKNTVIIRAFTKVFAIPGLRLGYGLGHPDLMGRLRERRLPWSVNTLAQCVGEYLPMSRDFLARTCAWIGEEGPACFEAVSRIPGLLAWRPETNFMLLKLPAGLSGLEFCRRMAGKGFLVRNASNFRFLADGFIRIAIRGREANRQMVKAMEEAVAGC